jgi:hypothetical protein
MFHSLLRHRLALAASVLFALAACQSGPPVRVFPAFNTSPALATLRPASVAVLPVEDGSEGRRATPFLPFLRQELNRQILDRRYSPLAEASVDTAIKGSAEYAAAKTRGTPIVEPAVLQKLAGHSSEDATLAVRVDHWDNTSLVSSKRLYFRLRATLVASSGQQLWYGNLGGEVKAGGAGAAPLDKDGMERSCIEILVRELLNELPARSAPAAQ